jgi:hypothetical protein
MIQFAGPPFKEQHGPRRTGFLLIMQNYQILVA